MTDAERNGHPDRCRRFLFRARARRSSDASRNTVFRKTERPRSDRPQRRVEKSRSGSYVSYQAAQLVRQAWQRAEARKAACLNRPSQLPSTEESNVAYTWSPPLKIRRANDQRRKDGRSHLLPLNGSG